MKVEHPHRQAEPQQLAERLRARRLPGVEEAVGLVRGVEDQVGEAAAERDPVHRRGRHAAAGAAHRREAERTVGERPGERDVGRHGDRADRHQHARPPHRVVEGVEAAIEQQRGQAEGGRGEVVGGLGGDRGRHARRLEQEAGVEQQRDPGAGEQQREPEALLQRGSDRLLAAGADVVRDGRRDRLQRTGQQHHHRDVVAAADRHAGEVLGAVAPGDHGVGHHHGHRQQLGDQDRPRQVEQLPDDGTGAGRREGGGAHEGRVAAGPREGAGAAQGGNGAGPPRRFRRGWRAR